MRIRTPAPLWPKCTTPAAPVTGRGGLPVPLPGRLVFLGAPAGGVGFGVPLGCPEVTGRAPGHAHAAFFVYVV